MKNPVYTRRKNDAYFTEAWATDQVLQEWNIPPVIWECAAGGRKMADQLQAAGRTVYASDIKTYFKKLDAKHDFLKMDRLPIEGIGAIVTNPPYGKGLPEAFIRKALWFMDNHNVRTVAMLLKSEYSHNSAQRLDLFGKHYACKLELTQRIRFIAGTTERPRQHHAWFIWDKNHTGQAYHKIQRRK